MKLKDYFEMEISEFWASIPGGKAAFENPVARPVADGEPSPVVHTQPQYRLASSLALVLDPAELAHWFSEFGQAATVELIRSVYRAEADLPESLQTKFYRR